MNYVSEIVRKIIVEHTNNSEIKDDDLLLENGIDSISMIEIVMGIEEKLEIEFEASKLNYETLKSINSICKYIESKTNMGDVCE